MNKYPLKHIMYFGEIKRYYFDKTFDESALCNNKCCPYYDEQMEQNCCYNDPETCDCRETTSLTVTFELTKDCVECCGTGKNMLTPGVLGISCPHCSDNGLPPGKVHRYWTPGEAAQEIKDKTGIDWKWPVGEPIWYHSTIAGWYLGGFPGPVPLIEVKAFPGQPAPAEDWKPLPEPPKC